MSHSKTGTQPREVDVIEESKMKNKNKAQITDLMKSVNQRSVPLWKQEVGTVPVWAWAALVALAVAAIAHAWQFPPL